MECCIAREREDRTLRCLLELAQMNCAVNTDRKDLTFLASLELAQLCCTVNADCEEGMIFSMSMELT